MSLNKRPSVFRRAPTSTTPSTPVVNGGQPQDKDSPATGGPKVLRDFREQIKKGLPVSLDLSTVTSVVDAVIHTESIDDRKLLLEHALTFISRLDEGPTSSKLQDKVVALLYNDLAHPAATCIGNKYAWRSADGSFNNIDLPDMGKAGTPYARSVQQSHPLPKNSLPDPGLVFDTLLRREGFVKHPAGLSSMMFSFAALVIHSVFRTSHFDVNINETSSYVDLSPLYGHNQEAQDRIRLRDGRGLLYPDTFAEDRLLLLPPAVCALLVLFSRNHNYIAKKLLEINERGTFVDPAKLSPDDPTKNAQRLAQEEELFQTARLINCGWFGSVVFSDYFSCILGLVRQGSSWSLNPFGEIRNEDHSVFERGKGNVCSVEFNCLYRWHATTSVEDEQWVENIFNQIFEGKAPETVTPADFKGAARKVQEMQPDITHWTFGRLQRQEDGTFKDADLANILHNATEHSAGAFRARGTPAAMRLHEIMGIEQNRRWGVCSLNDFRKYLGLKPYASFKEWNPDPEIADAAEKLYGDIDHLELYVGLQAEEAKPVVEGAGLCPGYTISRAILSDAIALTRGDRHFTYDYTPFNLTAWGFADCQRDPSAFGFGSTLGKLFLRTLPNDFTSNSVYAFFPLMTPDSMKTNLTKLELMDKYDLSRPKSQPTSQIIKEYAEVAEILKNTDGFVPPYASRASKVIKGNGFFIAADDPASGERQQREISAALLNSPESADKIGHFFGETTRNLIASSSFTLVGGKTRGVDLVRDVLKHVPVHWVATEIAGIKIKTKDTPHGTYTAPQLYEMLGDIYSFIFLEVEAAKVMVLQERVKGYVEDLLRHIKSNLVVNAGQRLFVAGLVSSVFSKQKKPESNELVKRLYEIGHSSDQVANSILAIMVGSTVELSLALTNMVNLYLGSDKDTELRALVKDSKAQLDGYVYEALRLDPPFQGVSRVAQKDQTVSTLSIQKDSRVFLNIANANLNGEAFPDPTAAVFTRSPKERYIHGDGLIRHLGEALILKIMAEVLRAVFGYENIRRGPGQSGVLKRFKDDARPDLGYAYLDQHQSSAPWPTSMVVQYEHAST